jgi:hypothetical protein
MWDWLLLCEMKRPNTVLKPGVGRFVCFRGHMQMQQVKQRSAWRCRREQYLRESGRHVDLISEGYESAKHTTKWTVVVGGRARGPLNRDLGTRLLLVKPSLGLRAGCEEADTPAVRGQCAVGPQ